MSRCVSVALSLGLVACTSGTAANPGGADGGNTRIDGHGGGGPDAFVPQDSPPGPFGCLGQPVPAGAPDPVTLSGTAQTLSGTTAVPAKGVAITAVKGDGTTLSTATTDSAGAYSLSLPTGGNALDVHLTATKSGDRPTALFPATKLYMNTDAGLILIISQSDFDFLASLSGENQKSSKAAIGLAVVDCEGNTLSGATVTTDPPGDVVYVSGGQPDTNATSTDSSGVALLFNVPAGNVTVSAIVGGMTLRSHSINAAAGVTTTAAIRP